MPTPSIANAIIHIISCLLSLAEILNSKASADALLAARRRHVQVQIVMDGNDAYTNQARRLERAFNKDNIDVNTGQPPVDKHGRPLKWGPDQSFVVFCKGSCRGGKANDHAKFYAFTQTGTAHDVVMVSSSNLNAGGAAKGWNDMYVIKDRPAILKEYAGIHAEMAQDSPNDGDTYHQYVNGPFVSRFYPKASGSDPVVNDLQKVRCHGATGGAGRVFRETTNPPIATGDGIAMAWRAGCRISNMEFMQFHPTCLYNLEVKNFLITEAVRGEGGILVNPKSGKRFMADYDERGELAPRDIVARAIDNEIKRDGLDYVHLDISHREPEFVRAHFPNIYEKLLGLGIDITREPIPVVPAQHYTCGGVLVDIDGRTDAAGLYAAGEVTQSGLHGANRLASNSLLECFVFGEAAARHILAHVDDLPLVPAVRAWDESRVADSDEEVVIQQCWGEIRRFMWNFVGIVRTTKRLERAKHRIDLLRQEVTDYYRNFRVTPDLIELRNLVEVADLIVRSALSRHESRGLHYTLDYPALAAEAVDTILVP